MTIDPSLKGLIERVEKVGEDKVTKKKEPTSVVSFAVLVPPLQPSIMQAMNQELDRSTKSRFIQRRLARGLFINRIAQGQGVGAASSRFNRQEK